MNSLADIDADYVRLHSPSSDSPELFLDPRSLSALASNMLPLLDASRTDVVRSLYSPVDGGHHLELERSVVAGDHRSVVVPVKMPLVAGALLVSARNCFSVLIHCLLLVRG